MFVQLLSVFLLVTSAFGCLPGLGGGLGGGCGGPVASPCAAPPIPPVACGGGCGAAPYPAGPMASPYLQPVPPPPPQPFLSAQPSAGLPPQVYAPQSAGGANAYVSGQGK